VRFVASVTHTLADGVRRATLHGELVAGADATTGLLVLAPDNSIEMANRPADHWLDELDAGRDGTSLPTAVVSVAARTRRIASSADEHAAGGIARARVRTDAGRWVVVRGSLLGDDDRGADGTRIAILLDAAGPPELAPLIADAYSFTERERRVTELIAQGFATSDIAEQLHLSPYTIQDHLKSIFDKSGTSSRGDLVARIFFDHHAPALSERSALRAPRS
jgi:DNA-binding CsgD family transcriptional regulator